MSDYTPTTDGVEDNYAYNEWDTDAAEEAPRREEFRRWLNTIKAEAWDEAYRQGIEDERTAEELQVGIGLGGYATANRSNPYRDQEPTS